MGSCNTGEGDWEVYKERCVVVAGMHYTTQTLKE